MDWKSYDPGWLVELARVQFPQEAWLPAALERCERAAWQSKSYLAFIERERATSRESEWEFGFNLTLRHGDYGELVLDVLRNREIGGIEFLSRL